MGHLLGYARVSAAEQDPTLQRDALTAAGCARLWVDVASGSRDDRPELAALLEQVLPGDTLVVWRLDRLGRSLRHLIDTVPALDARGVGFRSLQGVNRHHHLGRPAGVPPVRGAGRVRSRPDPRPHSGRTGGRAPARPPRRRPSALTPAKRRQAERMYADKTPVSEIAAVLGVGRATVYRALAAVAGTAS